MRRILVLASALAMLDALLFSVLSPLLPTYIDDLGLTKGEAGLLSSSYAWGAAAAAIPAGFLAQSLGPRRVICWSLAVLGGASVVVGWASHVAALEAGRFVQGFCSAVVWAGAMAWLIASLPGERKGAAIGTAAAAGGVGGLIGPAVGALGVAIGPELLFGGLAALTLVLCLLVALGEQGQDFERQNPREVASAAFSRPFLTAFLLLTAPALGFGFVLTLAPVKISDLGGGAGLVAVAFIAAGVVETALAPLAGHWSDRAGRLRPYLCGLAIFCVGLATMATASSPAIAALAVPVGSIGGGLFISPAFALFSDAAERTGLAQSHGFALSNTAFSSGLALGAFAGGVMAGAGGINFPFYVLIGMFAVLSLYASRGIVDTTRGATQG